MSHTMYAAKFEQTIIHQHVHLWRECQSHEPAHMLMRLYQFYKVLWNWRWQRWSVAQQERQLWIENAQRRCCSRKTHFSSIYLPTTLLKITLYHNLYWRLRTMSHTMYAAKFEQTIIHQHVHLWRECQSHEPGHMLMRLYPIDKSLVCLQSERRT
jgi:prephenate dehydrogenase